MHPIRRSLLVFFAVTVVIPGSGCSTSRQIEVAAVSGVIFNENAAAKRFATAITYQTISDAEDIMSTAEAFRNLHALLANSYPKVHTTMDRQLVSDFSLLFKWTGSDPSAKPVMILAHQDVVPIAPGTEEDWLVAPFAGVIKDGYIWGRGAWDNKGNLLAIMEAVELLISEGFQPRQTIYLAFGHDEEIGGYAGAAIIAKMLKSRGVKLDFVLDEGLLITQGILKGLSVPTALIGVAEKGALTLELNVITTPGHSSMPPPQTAIAILSAALIRLIEGLMPAELTGVVRQMLETVAPEMQGFRHMALSNLWLFGPLVKRELAKGISTNAMMRTTAAPTVFQAGEKYNVLPGHARAIINFRLLPGDSIAEVTDKIKGIVGSEIIVKQVGAVSEASAVSSTTAFGYRSIEQTIREMFPGAVVAPGLLIASTDSRHMAGISDNIYRFSPVRAGPEDLPRFHGTNERISLKNYAELIRFYHQLISNLSMMNDKKVVPE